MAEFRLVLGMAISLAQLAQAVGKLAFRPIAAAPTLREGPTELSLVSRGGGRGRSRRGGRQLRARSGSQGCKARRWGYPATAAALHQAGGAARQAGGDPGGARVR